MGSSARHCALICFPVCLAGTGGPSQPASSWVATELPSSPPTGTVAASPSGRCGGMLRPLPSSPLPGSPQQPQSSSQAASTQTGANHVVLHPRDVTGDSTSPSLAASPATDSAFRGELYWPTHLFYSFNKPLGFLKQKMLCFTCALFVTICMVS